MTQSPLGEAEGERVWTILGKLTHGLAWRQIGGQPGGAGRAPGARDPRGQERPGRLPGEGGVLISIG